MSQENQPPLCHACSRPLGSDAATGRDRDGNGLSFCDHRCREAYYAGLVSLFDDEDDE